MEFSCKRCYVRYQAPRLNRDPYCPECTEAAYEGPYWRDTYDAKQTEYLNNLTDASVLHLDWHDIRRALEEAQGHICAICGEAEAQLYIDHDHKTGLVRGFLCPRCNIALGNFRDDLSLLASAAGYIKDNYSHHTKVLYRPRRAW